MLIITKEDFSKSIEVIVLEKKMSYMDAIIWWCEQNEMEVEMAAKLVHGVLKNKLEAEASNLNYLAKRPKLPI